MKIDLKSNLYLVPNNTAWEDNNYQFVIGDYNDWLIPNNHNNNVPLVIILFLNSLFTSADYNQSENGQLETINDKLSYIVHAAKQKPNRFLILSFLFLNHQSPIPNAKMSSYRMSFNYKLHHYIKTIISTYSNIYALDMLQSFASTGLKNCLSARNTYLLECPLSYLGIQILRTEITTMLNSILSTPKKVIAIDCDNTLWGGVIGEDGIEGIILGQDGQGKAFVAFQKCLLDYKNQGFLLCLLSKNNEDDALEVFNKHPEMELSISDFVAWRINWHPKGENIADLATELDVGIDSFVFLDDNPLERAKMRHMWPQVASIEMPKSIFEWPSFISAIPELQKFNVTAEDAKKTEMYASRKKFKEQSKHFHNKTDFFLSLDMKASFTCVDKASLQRAEQLCAKTNQFNVRTKRYKSAELLEMIEHPNYEVFHVRLSDKFGDHGIVGLFIASFNDDLNLCFIDTFLMSCRVLGRNLEDACLQKLFHLARERGSAYCVAEFISTKRNQVFASFFADMGMADFKPDFIDVDVKAFLVEKQTDGSKLFIAPSSQDIGKNLKYFTIEG